MTTLPMPSLTSIDNAAAQLRRTATPREAALINTAQARLHKGVEIVATTDGALLISSNSGSGTHRLSSFGLCSCPATKTCHHIWVSRILELAHALPCQIPLTPFAPVATFNAARIIARVKAARTLIDDPLPDPGPGGPGVPGDERPRGNRHPSSWERFVNEPERQIQKSNMKAEMEAIRARPKLSYEQALEEMNALYS